MEYGSSYSNIGLIVLLLIHASIIWQKLMYYK
nr:MAG TPA: hypothetical protein [Caudoviricetes sp.]